MHSCVLYALMCGCRLSPCVCVCVCLLASAVLTFLKLRCLCCAACRVRRSASPRARWRTLCALWPWTRASSAPCHVPPPATSGAPSPQGLLCVPGVGPGVSGWHCLHSLLPTPCMPCPPATTCNLPASPCFPRPLLMHCIVAHINMPRTGCVVCVDVVCACVGLHHPDTHSYRFPTPGAYQYQSPHPVLC